MDETEIERLMDRLLAIRERVQWIADEEARSAWVNGWAAQGGLEPERTRLLDETDEILDRLTRGNKA